MVLGFAYLPEKWQCFVGQVGLTKTTDFVRICTFDKFCKTTDKFCKNLYHWFCKTTDKLECWAKAKNRQNWPPVLKSVMMATVYGSEGDGDGLRSLVSGATV